MRPGDQDDPIFPTILILNVARLIDAEPRGRPLLAMFRLCDQSSEGWPIVSQITNTNTLICGHVILMLHSVAFLLING